MEIFTLFHLSQKLKLIWWISLSLNFLRNWWKNIFSGQFHILQCKVSIIELHTNFQRSNMKILEMGESTKYFYDISLILFWIFGYISNSRWQIHWNLENKNNQFAIFENLITKCNRLSESLPPKSILEMLCSLRY